MRLSLIVAMSTNGAIGMAGGLPWRLASDLRRFKQLTMGHHLIMGRTTYDSIGRPLPGRTSVVISRQGDLRIPGALVVSSLAAAMEIARNDSEAFVIGGGQIYELALPQANRLYMTLVDSEIAGDTWFPKWNPSDWQILHDEKFAADEKNEYATRFRIYDSCMNPTPTGG